MAINDPNDLTNIRAWFTAKTAATVTESGGVLTGWPNQGTFGTPANWNMDSANGDYDWSVTALNGLGGVFKTTNPAGRLEMPFNGHTIPEAEIHTFALINEVVSLERANILSQRGTVDQGNPYFDNLRATEFGSQSAALRNTSPATITAETTRPTSSGAPIILHGFVVAGSLSIETFAASTGALLGSNTDDPIDAPPYNIRTYALGLSDTASVITGAIVIAGTMTSQEVTDTLAWLRDEYGFLPPFPGLHTVTDISAAADPYCIYHGANPAIAVNDLVSYAVQTTGQAWGVSIDALGYPVIDTMNTTGASSFGYAYKYDANSSWEPSATRSFTVIS